MEKLLQILKVLEMPLKIIIFIVIVSGILFFLPSSVRDYLLMTEFYSIVGPYLGPVFIISFLYVIFTIVCKFIALIIGKKEAKKKIKTTKELINNLSHKEIVVLREFYFQQSDVITAILEDEGVSSLLAKGIVRNVQNTMTMYTFGTPVRIQIDSEVKKYMTIGLLGLKEDPNKTDIKAYMIERPEFVGRINWLQKLQNSITNTSLRL